MDGIALNPNPGILPQTGAEPVTGPETTAVTAADGDVLVTDGAPQGPGAGPQGPSIDAPGANDGGEAEGGGFGGILSRIGEIFSNPITQGILAVVQAIPGIGQVVSALSAAMWIGRAVQKIMDPSNDAEGFSRLGAATGELAAAGLALVGAFIPGAGAFAGLTGMAIGFSDQREQEARARQQRVQEQRAEEEAGPDLDAAARRDLAARQAEAEGATFDATALGEEDGALFAQLQGNAETALADAEAAAEWRRGIEQLIARREAAGEASAAYEQALAVLNAEMSRTLREQMGGAFVSENGLQASIATNLPGVDAAEAEAVVRSLAVGNTFYVPTAAEFATLQNGAENAATQRQLYDLLSGTAGLPAELQERLAVLRALLGPEAG
ncbi:MAG: hypothetical protein AAFU77_16480 [Myxococcota bacterium]